MKKTIAQQMIGLYKGGQGGGNFNHAGRSGLIGGSGEGLTREAKKYKSADEFADSKVNAFHGTAGMTNFDTFDTGGLRSHFGSREQAQARLDEMASQGIKAGDRFNPHIKEVFLDLKKPFEMDDLADNWRSPSALLRQITERLKLPENSLNDEFDKIFERTDSDTGTIVEMLKNRGYDGISYRNEFEGVADPSLYNTGKFRPSAEITSGYSFIPFDSDSVKTREQLTDIWKEAHGLRATLSLLSQRSCSTGSKSIR